MSGRSASDHGVGTSQLGAGDDLDRVHEGSGLGEAGQADVEVAGRGEGEEEAAGAERGLGDVLVAAVGGSDAEHDRAAVDDDLQGVLGAGVAAGDRHLLGADGGLVGGADERHVPAARPRGRGPDIVVVGPAGEVGVEVAVGDRRGDGRVGDDLLVGVADPHDELGHLQGGDVGGGFDERDVDGGGVAERAAEMLPAGPEHHASERAGHEVRLDFGGKGGALQIRPREGQPGNHPPVKALQGLVDPHVSRSAG